MRICFLGNFLVDHSTETHHLKTLESLGHQVFPLQEGVSSSAEVLDIARECDLFAWVHTHGVDTQGIDYVLKTLRENKISTMTYHLDLWMGLERQKDMRTDPYWQLDHFFTVDRIMADYLNQNTPVKGHYLTAAIFHEDAYMAKPNEHPHGLKRPEVIFVGSRGYHPEWPYRERLVLWLQRTYGENFQHWGKGGFGEVRGASLNQLYVNTKVVVGDSLCLGFDYPDYWSDRVYETLGRGGMLIHPHVQGMGRQFTWGVHLSGYEYGNFDMLKERIDFWLANDSLRERMRTKGHERVRDHHTYKHRWTKILETLELS